MGIVGLGNFTGFSGEVGVSSHSTGHDSGHSEQAGMPAGGIFWQGTEQSADQQNLNGDFQENDEIVI